MSSSPGKPSGPARRIRALAIFIIIAIGFYTAGWYYFAGRLAEETGAIITRINESGSRANCENLEARGYPFRMGLFCDSVVYENTGDGIFITAGAIRSAAQIYKPNLVRTEIDSPARVEVPGLMPLELDWEWLGSSTRLARPLPERLSVVFRKLTVAIAEGYSFASGSLLTAENVEAHLRPAGVNLEFASSATGVTLPQSGASQKFETAADLMVEDGVKRLNKLNDLRGLAMEIRNVSLKAADGGSIAVSGPVFVDDAALLNGELTIAITDGAKLGDAIAVLVPAYADQIRTTLGAAQAGANGKAEILLRIHKGKVFAGLFPIAEIPPVH